MLPERRIPSFKIFLSRKKKVMAATWSPFNLHESFKERGCVGEYHAVIMETQALLSV